MRSVPVAAVLAVAALLPGGCVLLRAAAPAPPAALPTDAPPPGTIRMAVEPARRVLQEAWPNAEPVEFVFQGARCAIGAPAVLTFHEIVAGRPSGYALALTHDVAAGIMTGAWWTRYDVTDPASDPAAAKLLGANEIPCP
ncbi:MAG: hypothetical protein U0869_20305 [Chloroflexota bacterium]